MYRALIVVGGLLALAIILLIVWLLRKVVRAFSGTSCPEPECDGTMKSQTILHGPNSQSTDCFICDRCGHIEVLSEFVSG